MDRRELVLVVLLLLAVNLATGAVYLLNSAGGTRIGLTEFPLDDGWIHMVYSRGLATTLRPEYNPGQMESGMTSPLWALLNALFYWPARIVGANPTAAPKFLSMIFGIGAAFFLYLLARVREAPPALALAPALLLSLDPQWCFSRVSGMEVTLFTFLMLWCMTALDKDRESLLGWTMGLAAVARPEGLVLLAIVPPVWYLKNPSRRRSMRAWSQMLVPMVMLFGGWIIYNFAVTGFPLPNTFYVKGGNTGPFQFETFSFLVREIFLETGFFKSLVGIILYVTGCSWLLRKDLKMNAAVLFLPWLLLYGLAATREFPVALPYYWARYFHPALPFFLFPMAFGILALGSLLRGRWGKFHENRLAGTVAAAVIFLIVAAPGAASLPAQASLFTRNCRDINQGVVEPGKWLRENSQPEDWLVTINAGAIRYFSQRRTIDVVGLNNHRLVHHKEEGFDSKWSALENLVEEKKPAYFILFLDSTEWVKAFNLELVKVYRHEDHSVTRSVNQSIVLIFRPKSQAPGV